MVIWGIYVLLCVISLIEVFSAASSLSYKTGDYLGPLIQHAVFLAVGTVLVIVVQLVPCRFFRIIPTLFWPICILLLLLTLFSGSSVNGSNRFIPLPFVGFSFQPSEMAKGVIVVAVALILSLGQTERGADQKAMKKILMVSAPVFFLIITENLSTALLLMVTVCLMMFIGRVPMRQLMKLVGSIVGFVTLLVAVLLLFPSLKDVGAFHRLDTWIGRVVDHSGNTGGNVDPEISSQLDAQMAVYDAHMKSTSGVVADSLRRGREQYRSAKLDTLTKINFLREHAQRAHANIAIASSNVVGKAPGNSVQRDYLSQAYSDFIYAIIVEELGIWGAIGVAGLYIFLLFRAGRIASRCERNFPAFLVMGLAVMLVLQAVVNMLVAVGFAPVTGQPLPLISRGGTSTLMNCIYIGMILSVSRYARKQPLRKKTDDAPPSGESEKMQRAFESNDGLE